MDAGSLSAARHVEPFALLVAKIAYSNSDVPALTYRFERCPQASPCSEP